MRETATRANAILNAINLCDRVSNRNWTRTGTNRRNHPELFGTRFRLTGCYWPSIFVTDWQLVMPTSCSFQTLGCTPEPSQLLCNSVVCNKDKWESTGKARPNTWPLLVVALFQPFKYLKASLGKASGTFNTRVHIYYRAEWHEENRLQASKICIHWLRRSSTQQW